jgi:hypothetical protein
MTWYKIESFNTRKFTLTHKLVNIISKTQLYNIYKQTQEKIKSQRFTLKQKIHK